MKKNDSNSESKINCRSLGPLFLNLVIFLRDCAKIPLIVTVTAASLAGVWGGYKFFGFTPAVYLSLFLIFVALSILSLWLCKPFVRKIFLVLIFFVAGFARSSYDIYRIRSDISFVESSSSAISVECTVAYNPSVRPLKGRAARYRFKVSDVHLIEGGRHITAPLIVNWYGDKEGLVTKVPERGNKWSFAGRMYVGEDRSGDPRLILNSGESHSKCLSSGESGALAVRVAEFSKGASSRIAIGIEDWHDVVAIHQAVLLGFKSKIPWALRQKFAWSGTIHVFAISGLHIALIASVLVLFISSCGVPRYYWVYILAPLLFIYTFATGLRPSAVRACIMALFYFSAPVIGRRFNALSALAATALVVHLFAPSYIFNLGCILSFSVMLGLIVLFKPVCEIFKKAFKVEDLELQSRLYSVSEDYKKAAYLSRCAAVLTFIAELMAVTTSAWLASMPLSAYFFERITPGGLLANMIITPCALMLVTAGVLGFVASFFSVWLAACFNNAAAVFTTIMIKTASLISGCRFTHFEVHNWPLWAVWLWFAALLMLAWMLRRIIDRKKDDLGWIGE
ncbi:MAG: ComEC/Rec2 family competence protein [Kiritimatiellae bacterium]|jgi:ComEC/Rec2-related protein|nr:ComEC/Rec2 family competence protein [Kiritimatiellia bacterium]